MSGPDADRPRADDAGPIDLSAQPPFRLGALEIRPSTRQVRADGGGERTAEPRVLQVLVALAAADGAVVSRDTLVARCWEGRIVGEDAINRAIAKTRQLADLTQPPAFAVETIPRVGYRLRTGGTPADAPIPLAEAAPGPAAGSRVNRRGLALGVAAVGVTGAAGAAALYLGLKPRPKTDPLVAVLPFDNLSPDPQLGYFADGLAEDILNALIRGGSVRVTSRTSSFTFRGAAKARAAEALKADYLLDGSVLREGGRLRVNAQLTDVAARQTLWSQTYDRDVAQGLQIEDEVAGRVAQALKVRFEAQPGARSIDPVAFDLYLRGREATDQHNADSVRAGADLLRSALTLAPRFAPAWFELARNRWRSGFLSPLTDQARDYQLGQQAAQKALELDPRNGAVLGVITQMTPAFGHWRETDAGLLKGLKLSPNDPNLLVWRCNFLEQTGRIRAALDFARRGQALNPFDIFPNSRLSEMLGYVGDYAAAIAVLDRMRLIFPGQLATFWNRFYLFVTMGRYADALAVLEDPNHPPDAGDEFPVLKQVVRAAGSGVPAERAAAVKALLGLCGEGMGYASNALIALGRLKAFDEAVDVAASLYLKTGSIPIDRTVQFLGSSRYPPHGEAETAVLFHPLLRPLRQSGRLNPVFDGIGLTDFWRATGGPDV